MGRTPIAGYGLIGDTRTAALAGPDGSIDWLCLPRFDSDPVLARLIGGEDSGCWALTPAEPFATVEHAYAGDTALLRTTWHVDGAEIVLEQAMVAEFGRRLMPQSVLVRRVTVTGRAVSLRHLLDPRRGEHRTPPRVERRNGRTVFGWGPLVASLESTHELIIGHPHDIVVTPDQPLVVSLSVVAHGPLVHVSPDDAWREVREDCRGWRDWCRAIEFDGPYRGPVVRSLMTLRLLTYSPSGAPVAAPTTSLPESLGGGRNWDYRFAWPRDASIGVGAFMAVGREHEARSFLAWLMHATQLHRPRLPVLLTLDGRSVRSEREWAWPGYAGSRPVRVGNAACNQHQLDGYGWVVDAAAVVDREPPTLQRDVVRAVAAFTDEVARTWREPDSGVWEIRGEEQHHVHSKLMAWLALDRAGDIGARHGLAGRRRAWWRSERDAVRADVLARGCDPSRGTLVRAYGSSDLDAALLMLPLTGMLALDDPVVLGTIEAVRRELTVAPGLVRRYLRDNLDGEEGAFVACSGWLAMALAMVGRLDEAAEVLDVLVDLAGPLGLLSEQVDPGSGEFLGNHPQALSHAAFVQGVLALEQARR